MTMLSKELESALTSAVNEVKKRNHEFLTLEHLLYAISIEEQGEADGRRAAAGCPPAGSESARR